MATTEFIAAIELGSSKITGVAGRKNSDGSMQILAYAQEDSSTFIRKGVIFNLDKTAQSLTSIINRLEGELKNSIAKVYVGIGGQSLRTVRNVVSRDLEEEAIISEELVNAIGDENVAIPVVDMDILDVAPQEYKVGNNLQANPVGLVGSHIEGRFLNIVARSSVRKNLEHCFQQAKIDIADQLIAPLVKRTLLACRRALKDAGVEADEVLEVVMVGGSTRVPLVRERVGEFFGRPPLTSIDPDKVVAIGAAIQADILVGNKPDSEMLLLDVIPLSLGHETMGGLVEKVIPRNTTIPVARAQEFTTFKDGQTAMSIHVMQGERELVQDCRSLARFALRGIPALPAGGAHIRVPCQVDADGLLSVTAMEKSTGVEASIQVKPSYGLTDGEIATMIKDSMSYAEQDIQARMLAEQKVEAARVLESLTSALAADAALLSAAERQAIDAAAEQVRAAAAGDDADAIKEAIKNIDTQTQEFAARRMDQSVRIALKGQSVDEV